MEREEILKSVVKHPFLRTLGKLQGLLLMLFISSLFIWIWHSWNLAWKLGLTGLFGCIVAYFVYSIVKQSVNEIIDEKIKKQTPTAQKSKFQEKLEDAIEKSKNKDNGKRDLGNN